MKILFKYLFTYKFEKTYITFNAKTAVLNNRAGERELGKRKE